MNFGLRQQDVVEITNILCEFPAVEEALIFGSRAKGTYKKGSDIDIAVKGSEIDHKLVMTLASRFNEETTLPYFFDIVHYDALTDPQLRAHIDRVGKRIV